MQLKAKVRTPPGGGTNSNFELHRLLRSWGEGAVVGDIFSTGEDARPGEATWNSRFHPSTSWSAPGAEAPTDFASAVSGTTFISGLGRYEFSNLAADVQFWLTNAAANFGWILLSQDEAASSTARRFGSREDCFNPPILLVEGGFPPVPPRINCVERAGNNFIAILILAERGCVEDQPQRVETRNSQVWCGRAAAAPDDTAALRAKRRIADNFRFNFAAAPGHACVVEYRDAFGSGDWNVLTSLPFQTATSSIVISNALISGSRVFRVGAQFFHHGLRPALPDRTQCPAKSAIAQRRRFQQ